MTEILRRWRQGDPTAARSLHSRRLGLLSARTHRLRGFPNLKVGIAVRWLPKWLRQLDEFEAMQRCGLQLTERQERRLALIRGYLMVYAERLAAMTPRGKTALEARCRSASGSEED